MRQQETDFSIFIIALVTILIIRAKIVITGTSRLAKVAVCGVVWLLPVATSCVPISFLATDNVKLTTEDGKGSIALYLDLYRPVSGHWCWIKAKPVYYRYLLTHMWRLLFIALSTAIYAYAYFYLNRHFRQLRLMGSQNGPSLKEDEAVNILPIEKTSLSPPSQGVIVSRSFTCQAVKASYHKMSASSLPSSSAKSTARHDPAVTELHIKKMLLLNAYPIWYIVKWIPDIANRIFEATGHRSLVLAILKASMHCIGLASAITFFLNDRILG